MTFSSAELIDALRRRRRRSLRPERPSGEFPPGWAAWFDAMTVHVGAVTGATAESILAIFRAREPGFPAPALAALDRWRAFTVLWRQQWHPASEDERGIRVFASVVTLVVHVFLAVFLLYVAYVRIMAIPEQASEGEDVIQVEYIGEGTPDAEGGGPPQGETVAEEASRAAAPASTSQPQPQQTAARPTPPAISQPRAAPPALAPDVAQPAVRVPPVDQPLQVTETPEADSIFTVPPVRMADVSPAVQVPELGAPAPQLEVVEVPTPAVAPTLQPREPAPSIELPGVARQDAQVTVRDIPAPPSPVELPRVSPRPLAAPDLSSTRAPSVAVRDIPAPASTASSAATTPSEAGQAAAAAQSSSSTQAGTAVDDRPASGRESASQGTRQAATSAGSGTRPSPRPGALPSPKPGDDWGLSDRNRPGGRAGTPGLFDADGTPRLASGDGKVGGGLPPGTITEDYEKIDRHGTWLKRPPFDYTPTAFDRFWVPDESLLQEWVRRSIREVLIPIPGTSKTITCSVVLLAVGGACDIIDPNMQDVEAGARKPPDVPFKPELQENRDALGKPPGAE